MPFFTTLFIITFVLKIPYYITNQYALIREYYGKYFLTNIPLDFALVLIYLQIAYFAINKLKVKEQLYKLWKEKDKTFVIPFAEYEKKQLVDVCFEFEKYFDYGQANVYASPAANSKSFPAHADSTENFLFHTEGETKWTIYEEFSPGPPKNIIDEFILTPGDLLYIPSYQYHKVDTIGPRILISIHFKNKKEQSLDKFKITTINQNNRPKWYDWSPVKQKINKSTPARRMNKARWSKPYFNKL